MPSRIRHHFERVLLAAESAAWLVVASLAVRLLPGHRVTRLLGRSVPASPARPVGRAAAGPCRVGRAVARTSRVLPWNPTCLPQAVAVRAMLRCRGISARSHVGVTSSSPFAAHAWVSVDQHVVAGGPVGEATELAAFE